MKVVDNAMEKVRRGARAGGMEDGNCGREWSAGGTAETTGTAETAETAETAGNAGNA